MQGTHKEHHALSVRTKILLIVAVSIVVLSAVIYLLSTNILLASYRAIEREAMAQDLRRATDAIQEFSNQQMIKLADWASWDEAYDYIASRDPEWVDTTIYATGLANLDINATAWSDTEGNIFEIMVADIYERVEVSSSTVTEYFAEHKDLLVHPSPDDSTQGIVMLPDGPLILVSLPSLQSDGTGPIHGSISFMRYLDDEKVRALSDITHLYTRIYPYAAEDLPEDVAAARTRLAAGLERVIEPVSPDIIVGYTLMRDVYGDPALIVRVETPRPIYAQGLITFYFYMAVGAAAVLIFGVVILLALDRLVIARFLRLTDDVDKINDDKDLSVRVDGGVMDEIGRLGEQINRLLGWLLQAKEAEAASRREMVNLLTDLKKEQEQREEMAQMLAKKKE